MKSKKGFKWQGSGNDATNLMSIPSYMRMINPYMSLNETKWERLLVKFKDPSDRTVTKEFIKRLKMLPTKINVYNYYDGNATMKEISSILDIIFSVIIAITMFLCFFSLCSSMSANILDQTKEIGVLRAMGYSKKRI